MFDMGFNIYAFSNHKTKEEYSALLDEAIRLVDEVGEMIDDMCKKDFPRTRMNLDELPWTMIYSRRLGNYLTEQEVV